MISAPQNLSFRASATMDFVGGEWIATISDFAIPTVEDGCLVVIASSSSNLAALEAFFGASEMDLVAWSQRTTRATVFVLPVGVGGITEDIKVRWVSAGVAAVAAFYVTGVRQDVPVNAFVGELGGFGSSISNDLTTTVDDCFIFDSFTRIGTGSLTPTSGQTAIFSEIVGTQRYSASYKTTVGAAGVYSLGRTETFINWSQSIVALQPPVAPPPPPSDFLGVLGFGVSKKLGKVGDPDPLGVKGIWQMRKTKRGKVPVRMKFYTPTNPQTESQQANRAKFAAAMSAWHALTTSQQSAYNVRARKLGMFGRNLYIREYYQSN